MLKDKTGKISASEKRVKKTKCVASAWKKACAQLPVKQLFRGLRFIWSGGGFSLKIPVLKDYKYNPALNLPTVRVQLTETEQKKAVDGSRGCLALQCSKLVVGTFSVT